MLKMARLPKPFWGEAIHTACYLINRFPSIVLCGEIPVWIGKSVSYSHLKVFGCKAFVHVSKEHRSKLDDRAIQYIFLGYADEEFGYRLWDSEKKKSVRSGDMVFHEDQMISNFENIEKSKSVANEVVLDLNPVPPPLPHVEDGGEVQEEVVGNNIL